MFEGVKTNPSPFTQQRHVRQSFLTSTLDGRVFASHSGRYAPAEEDADTHEIGGWGGGGAQSPFGHYGEGLTL